MPRTYPNLFAPSRSTRTAAVKSLYFMCLLGNLITQPSFRIPFLLAVLPSVMAQAQNFTTFCSEFMAPPFPYEVSLNNELVPAKVVDQIKQGVKDNCIAQEVDCPSNQGPVLQEIVLHVNHSKVTLAELRNNPDASTGSSFEQYGCLWDQVLNYLKSNGIIPPDTTVPESSTPPVTKSSQPSPIPTASTHPEAQNHVGVLLGITCGALLLGFIVFSLSYRCARQFGLFTRSQNQPVQHDEESALLPAVVANADQAPARLASGGIRK